MHRCPPLSCRRRNVPVKCRSRVSALSGLPIVQTGASAPTMTPVRRKGATATATAWWTCGGSVRNRLKRQRLQLLQVLQLPLLPPSQARLLRSRFR